VSGHDFSRAVEVRFRTGLKPLKNTIACYCVVLRLYWRFAKF
jgi:hypothetical protein